MKRMLYSRVVVATFVVLLLIPAIWAEPDGATNLTNSNVADLVGIVISVTSSHDADGNLVLSVQLINNPLTNTPLGIDAFFYNAGNVIVDVSEAGWNTNYDGSTADGFGDLLSRRNDKPAGTGGISSPIVFTLNGDPAVPVNSNGGKYVVHIRFDGGCSGWVSDGTSSSIGSNPYCTSLYQLEVPEFGSTAVAAVISTVSTIGFLAFRRRRIIP